MSKGNRNIGFSVAEPVNWKEWGLSSLQLRDAMVDLSRYAIAFDYDVSYGGKLEYKDSFNFSELLREIVSRYSHSSNLTSTMQARKRISNYLAWYVSEETGSEIESSYSGISRIFRCPFPIDYVTDHTEQNELLEVFPRAIKAMSLTNMRKLMTENIDARILLGGKVVGSSGFFPGLLEEAVCAAVKGIPIYIVGGFGGCSALLGDLLSGKSPMELSEDFQLTHNPERKTLFREYQSLISSRNTMYLPSHDLNTTVKWFGEVGFSGLKNGLSEEENMRLLRTKNNQEILRLVFKGINMVVSGNS